MKLHMLFLIQLFALTALPFARGDDNCDAICNERTVAVVREKDELWHSREAVIREKDELFRSREDIIREKDQFGNEKERLIAVLQQMRQELQTAVNAADEAQRSLQNVHNEQGGNQRELEELRGTVEKQKTDMAHYQKVAQDNQKYMQEYKNQLASQRDRAAKLDQALKVANAKIEELENTSLLMKLKKELTMSWKQIVEYWVAVRGKGKTGGEF
jgi:DNA repair exonuclease SbcCD ATPase subunit